MQVSIPCMEHMGYNASNLYFDWSTRIIWNTEHQSIHLPISQWFRKTICFTVLYCFSNVFYQVHSASQNSWFSCRPFWEQIPSQFTKIQASSSLRNRRGKIAADPRWDLRLVFFSTKDRDLQVAAILMEASKLLFFIRFLRGALKIHGEDRNKNHIGNSMMFCGFPCLG